MALLHCAKSHLRSNFSSTSHTKKLISNIILSLWISEVSSTSKIISGSFSILPNSVSKFKIVAHIVVRPRDVLSNQVLYQIERFPRRTLGRRHALR